MTYKPTKNQIGFAALLVLVYLSTTIRTEAQNTTQTGLTFLGTSLGTTGVCLSGNMFGCGAGLLLMGGQVAGMYSPTQQMPSLPPLCGLGCSLGTYFTAPDGSTTQTGPPGGSTVSWGNGGSSSTWGDDGDDDSDSDPNNKKDREKPVSTAGLPLRPPILIVGWSPRIVPPARSPFETVMALELARDSMRRR